MHTVGTRWGRVDDFGDDDVGEVDMSKDGDGDGDGDKDGDDNDEGGNDFGDMMLHVLQKYTWVSPGMVVTWI